MGMEHCPLLTTLFASFPEALILCDQEGNILQLNPAALTLFEEPSQRFWQAKPCQQFLQFYKQDNDLLPSLFSLSGFADLHLEQDTAAPSATPVLLQTPSGHQFLVQQRCALLRDEHQLEDSLARVEVKGDGPGMTEEEQAHLWDRFYRARGNTVQHELDLSLGLSFYLCRVLTELHQGQVGVKSVPGHGTTFWLTIPLASPLS